MNSQYRRESSAKSIPPVVDAVKILSRIEVRLRKNKQYNRSDYQFIAISTISIFTFIAIGRYRIQLPGNNICLLGMLCSLRNANLLTDGQIYVWWIWVLSATSVNSVLNKKALVLLSLRTKYLAQEKNMDVMSSNYLLGYILIFTICCVIYFFTVDISSYSVTENFKKHTILKIFVGATFLLPILLSSAVRFTRINCTLSKHIYR